MNHSDLNKIKGSTLVTPTLTAYMTWTTGPSWHDWNTVTSHDRHGFPRHRLLEYLLPSGCSVATTKTKHSITDIFRELTDDQWFHYCDLIMSAMASQITSLTIVYSTFYSDADQRSKKTSKLCVTGLCAGNSPVTGEFPHKWPVTRKMFPFDDVIMSSPIGLVIWKGLSIP